MKTPAKITALTDIILAVSRLVLEKQRAEAAEQ
jgi:hypothetical protein